jgi:hypothetical protein
MLLLLLPSHAVVAQPLHMRWPDVLLVCWRCPWVVPARGWQPCVGRLQRRRQATRRHSIRHCQRAPLAQATCAAACPLTYLTVHTYPANRLARVSPRLQPDGPLRDSRGAATRQVAASDVAA